eukprot:10874688-Alexandrium_andersonii.AAC.1
MAGVARWLASDPPRLQAGRCSCARRRAREVAREGLEVVASCALAICPRRVVRNRGQSHQRQVRQESRSWWPSGLSSRRPMRAARNLRTPRRMGPIWISGRGLGRATRAFGV